jgi:hypothetical protein
MANSGSQLLTITERLPPEIMIDIFISCIPLMMDKRKDADFQRDISIPLSLSSVCRLWRSIAQSTPALWTSFRIYIPSRDFRQRIKHAQQWLSRSGKLPLSIQIRRHPSFPLKFNSEPLAGKLIDLVNSYSHRWESLEIAVAPHLLPRFHGLSKSTSILKTLIVSPTGSGPFGPSYTWLLGNHLNNITHFTARYIGVDLTLEILRLSPQLQECFLIELWEGYDDIPLPSSHLLHARLETLHVDVFDPVLDELLNSINLPSLKSFSYGGGDHLHILPFNTTVAFLNFSGCLLNTFSLQDIVVAEEEIIRLLFEMPYLETLTLGPPSAESIPYVTDRILNILADTAAISAHLDNQPDRPFLDKLRSFKCIAWRTFSWECIPIVFGHRTKERGASGSPRTNQRPLRSFRMELYSDYDPDPDPPANIVAELKRLRAEEGYEIQILDYSVNSGKFNRDLLEGESI